MNGWMDGWMNEWMDGCTDEWLDVHVLTWEVFMYQWIDVMMNGWMDECIDGYDDLMLMILFSSRLHSHSIPIISFIFIITLYTIYFSCTVQRCNSVGRYEEVLEAGCSIHWLQTNSHTCCILSLTNVVLCHQHHVCICQYNSRDFTIFIVSDFGYFSGMLVYCGYCIHTVFQ